jgi:hypothetical protein
VKIAIFVVYVLSLALWAGGLVVLGAIVAPTVFGIVPAPTSADAMTVVFRKFDVVAIACAVSCLLAEALLAWRGGKSTRIDLVRGGSAVCAAGLAITEAAILSPVIRSLHESGAVRGLGEAGLRLERVHRYAELAAKTELVLLLIVLVLLVRRARTPPA